MNRKSRRIEQSEVAKINKKSLGGRIPNMSGDERCCGNCRYSDELVVTQQALGQPGLPRDEVCCLHSPNSPLKKIWAFCHQHKPKE